MLDLHDLAYGGANFACSATDRLREEGLIKGPRPFYYRWGGPKIEILLFTDRTDPNTARLFRYTEKEIRGGVDLERDEPELVGQDVVNFLEEQASQIEQSSRPQQLH
jgi:hypothetical protein